MKNPLDLGRRFSLLTEYSQEKLISASTSTKPLGWDDLLRGKFSAIIGRANFGKTTELQIQAGTLRDSGKHSVFIALNKVLEQDEFTEALDAENERAFSKWRTSSVEELTLFVDSLDEASLSREDGLRVSLRRVFRAVNWPASNIRWVLSSRPAVFSPEILAMLQAEFGATLYSGETTKELAEKGADKISSQPARAFNTANAEDTGSTTSNPSVKKESIKIYSLLPLTREAAIRYLSLCLSIKEPEVVLKAADGYGLSDLYSGPGSLDLLAYINLASNPPICLTHIYDRMVDAVQLRQRGDPREIRMGGVSSENLDTAVRRLASASVVCQLPNIELSDDELSIREGILSARSIVASFLSEKSLNYLLGSRLFIDSGHHQVKIYPEILLPYLAAKHLASLVKSPEDAARLINNFKWSAPSGEGGVFSAYLPLAGWLATFSMHCRTELIKIDPQAVVFFGDMRNTNISISEASTALSKTIERLALDGDLLGRQHFRLTAENYWQAGKPGIEPTLVDLFQKYGDDFYARDALLDIASYSKLDTLREVVLRSHGGDYAKLIEHTADLLYMLSLGKAEDARELCRQFLMTSHFPERTASRLISFLGWRFLNAKEIGKVVLRQFREGQAAFQISWTLTHEIAERAEKSELYTLTRYLLLHLVSPSKGRRVGPGTYQSGQSLVELVGELLAILIEKSAASFSRLAKFCLVLSRFMSLNYSVSDDTRALRAALEKNSSVRRELIKGLIGKSQKTQGELYKAICVNCNFCPLEEADAEFLDQPEFIKLIQDMKSWAQTPSRASQPRRDKVPELDADSKAELEAVLPGIKDGTEIRALTWIGTWLTRTGAAGRYGECNFSIFESQAGAELSAATRTGLGILWRTTAPKWDEEKPNSTYHITIAGLQGLFLDLGDGSKLPNLSEKEIRQAIRYAQFEINGYPKWFGAVVQLREDVAYDEFSRILNNAELGLTSKEKAETLISHLNQASDSIGKRMAPRVYEFIKDNETIPAHALEVALQVIGANFDEEGYSISELEMRKRVFGPYAALPISSEPSEPSKARSLELENALVWANFWLTCDSKTFTQEFEALHVSDGALAAKFIFEFSAYLGEDRYARLPRIARAKDGLKTLAKLYMWVSEVVREEDDLRHDDGKVYSINARDNAQSLRDGLIPAIASSKAKDAYSVLDSIRLAVPAEKAKNLRRVQFKLCEEREASLPIRQQDYLIFESNFAPPISQYQSFAAAVFNDLLIVKREIEHGDFSLRRFFSEIDYESHESNDARLALEQDFQILLGSELKHLAGSRYAVSLEPILPNSTRRDVLCEAQSFRATIELKMSERWTLADYLESLEHQLVGQYMQALNSKIGFFVVVLQRANRKWKGPSGGFIRFQELLEILSKKAIDLTLSYPIDYLRVIGIDATPRENFRVLDGTDKSVSGSIKNFTTSTKRKKNTN